MEETNHIIKLCQKGIKLESEGNSNSARELFMQAWNNSSNSYESSIAAHFVARQQNNLEDTLHWNKESLRFADETKDDRVKNFYPSLYFCLGFSYENLKDYSNARKYFDMAYEKVAVLEDDDYGKNLRKNLSNARRRIKEKI